MHEIHENEGFRHLPNEGNLINVEKILEEEVEGERERFWEVKGLERLREIKRNES